MLVSIQRLLAIHAADFGPEAAAAGEAMGFFGGFVTGIILQVSKVVSKVIDTISEESQLNRDLAFCSQ